MARWGNMRKSANLWKGNFRQLLGFLRKKIVVRYAVSAPSKDEKHFARGPEANLGKLFFQRMLFSNKINGFSQLRPFSFRGVAGLWRISRHLLLFKGRPSYDTLFLTILFGPKLEGTIPIVWWRFLAQTSRAR
jgi:hypothetical protein